jgi:hypothetical protein
MVGIDAGHAFISYVSEDSQAVTRIQSVLEAAGVDVWRDTKKLWPGQDWKLRIREAITRNTLVFVACFSDNSTTKELTYQREELLLAAEQLRLRSPEQAWFIPVRLSDCKLPPYDVGAGRTFDSFQRVDLIGDNWDDGIARLVTGVLKILTPSASEAPIKPTGTSLISSMRALLLDDRSQIDLEELVRAATNQAYGVLTNPTIFPTSTDRLTNDTAGVRWFVDQANRYWTEVSEPRDALLMGCAWGREHHNALWSMTIERIATTAVNESGLVILNELRRYPTTILLYAGGLSAIHRENYLALKAITWDAESRTDHAAVPMIGVGHAWLPFGNFEIGAQILALQSAGEEITDETIEALRTSRRGKRFTAVSDHLHDALREPARVVIDDDRKYTATFDRMEVMFGLLAADAEVQAKETGGNVWGPWYGSYTWRSKYDNSGLEILMQKEFQSNPSVWPPVQAGLFGGQAERAEAAFSEVIAGAQAMRERQW